MNLNDNDKSGDSDLPVAGGQDGRLLCLACGYDLRGHDGEPVCCPECGGENTRDDLAIAARLTDEDFKEFETAPTAASASFLCMLGGAAVYSFGMLGCSIVLILPALIAWLVSAQIFGRKHEFRPGWLVVLL